MKVFVLLHVKHPHKPTVTLLDSHYEKSNITHATAASSILVHWQPKTVFGSLYSHQVNNISQDTWWE
jgi:hypothetical protein